MRRILPVVTGLALIALIACLWWFSSFVGPKLDGTAPRLARDSGRSVISPPLDGANGRQIRDVRAPKTCLLTVLDAETGGPIVGARAKTMPISDAPEHGLDLDIFETDQRGQCQIKSRRDSDIRVEVEAYNYSSANVVISSEEYDKQISLMPLVGLQGIVVWAGSRAPVPGVQVVAFDSESRIPSAEAVLIETPSDRLARAATDSEGRFQFIGLSKARKYFLFAGSPGVMSRSLVPNIHPEQVGVAIEVYHAYGVMLRLLTHNSDQLDYPTEHSESIRSETWSDTPDAKSAPLIPAIAALAGVPVDALQLGATGAVRLFTSSANPPSVGPLHSTIHMPGYEDATVEFTASRLDLRLETCNVELMRACQGWADLEIRPVGITPSVRELIRLVPLRMNLELRTASGRQDIFLFEFGPSESVMLTGLPVGQTVANVHTRDRVFVHRFPPGVIIDSLNGPLEVDFSAVGLIRLDLRTIGQVTSNVECQVMLSDGIPEVSSDGNPKYRNVRFLTSTSSNRLIGPIANGTYTLVLSWVGRMQEKPVSRTVQVIGGEVITLEMLVE